MKKPLIVYQEECKSLQWREKQKKYVKQGYSFKREKNLTIHIHYKIDLNHNAN